MFTLSKEFLVKAGFSRRKEQASMYYTNVRFVCKGYISAPIKKNIHFNQY